MKNNQIKCANTKIVSAEKAVLQLSKELQPTPGSTTLLFASKTYDFKILENAINEHFKEKVICCSTAGEIAHNGYEENSISGISFLNDSFQSSIIEFPCQENIDENQLADTQSEIIDCLTRHHNEMENGKSFALLLIDGLTMYEESVTSYLSQMIPADIPIVGGSAGDDMNLEETLIFHNGSFKPERAVVVLITTSVPFEPFKSHHFSASNIKMVITDAIPEERLVREIDGEPAVEAYAKSLNIPASDFGPHIYSQHPVMVKIGEDYFVRSIQRVNQDGSLIFSCAIEEGCILTLGTNTSIIKNVKNLYRDIETSIGEISKTLLFECIFRRLEVLSLEKEEQAEIMNIYQKGNPLGFHTYGEQFDGVHINQTITGIAFGYVSR